MTHTITIESEMKRRTDLIENADFRKVCAKAAKQIGITLEEWNENKAVILMHFANQVCKIENSK